MTVDAIAKVNSGGSLRRRLVVLVKSEMDIALFEVAGEAQVG
jgi:hypothetical protein